MGGTFHTKIKSKYPKTKCHYSTVIDRGLRVLEYLKKNVTTVIDRGLRVLEYLKKKCHYRY